jgi:hypothetical protein
MLVGTPADGRSVVPRALVMCAFICCSLVLASLGLFALGQANGASKHQVATISSTSTARTTPPATPPGQPRRFIDGAASTLTAPFRSLVHSDSEWATRIGYTVLALIVYGFGLGYLARWART